MADLIPEGDLRPKRGMVLAWSQGMGPVTHSFQA